MAATTIELKELLGRIREYRTKFYQNQLLKGLIFSAALLLSAYLFVNTLEYFGRFNSTVRAGLLISFLATLGFSLYKWVLTPIISLYGLRRNMTDEEAAVQIGHYFPQIGDKLLNTLQLGKLSTHNSDLIQASIRQKSSQLMIVRFSDAIQLQENKRYLKYAIPPLVIIASILLINPRFFTTSSERIINYKQVYDDAPFTFNIATQDLKAFRNEDYVLPVQLVGDALPEAVYLVIDQARFKLTPQDASHFSYTFNNLQRTQTFYLEGGGYRSASYTLQVIDKPSLLSFNVSLQYPAYLNKPREVVENVGNITVPEGTVVEWHFNTAHTKEMSLTFTQDSSSLAVKNRSGDTFEVKKSIRKSGEYIINMQNEHLPSPEQVTYYLEVIPDLYPQLSIENFQDTTLYNYLVVGGTIGDDYGISQLKLHYQVHKEGQEATNNTSFKSINIPFNTSITNQSFYLQWHLDSLQLQPGDKIEYYAQVWDNDAVNGAKSTRSAIANFIVPSKKEISKEIEEAVKQTESQMEKALEKAQSLKKDIQNLENKLRSNRALDFQEKRQAEEILRKRESLVEEFKAIQEQNKALNEKSSQFNQQSPEMQEKLKQLEQIIKDMTDQETNKLYEQLEKLLEQKHSERMTHLLEKLKNKQQNSEKELERTLKLFKQLQLEQKVDNLVDQLEELANQEEQLAEKTLDDKKAATSESLQQEQQKIEEAFKDLKEELKEAEELANEIGQELENPEEDSKSAEEEMQKSQQQLGDKKNKQAAQSQKNAAKSMKKMAQALEQQMQGAESMQMQLDLDALRDILENLIRASFEQEQLMNDFKGVSLQDPRFVTLGQKQLKLMDDTKIIEDSLYSLANRVVQIQSFITRELNDMKMYMNESVQAIKDRHLPIVASKQQFSMTSMNNLALMLSDVFKQMQEQMAAMAMPGSEGKSKKPGGNGGASELQKKLNEQLQKMGEGQGNGKGDKGRSEQLARMAAEQAQLRKMIQDLLNEQKGTQLGNKIGNDLKEIMDMMDKSETDLVNKRVNPDLINRNNQIMTRLLESEKAMREQDEDNQRKGEAAKRLERQPPPEFEKYIQEKAKQTELLRTIPANFSPYYKREVEAYFKKSQQVR